MKFYQSTLLNNYANLIHRFSTREDGNLANPPQCDALITNSANTPLIVMVADFSPILFYDVIQRNYREF